MRADRLVATLLLMQARGRVTAAEVAAELEVSVATARRDLEALSTAGIPVYPQPGRGGGWSLVGGARTDLTGLTVVGGAGAVPAGRVVVRPVRRRDLRAAQAGPRAAGDVPRGGRGRRTRGAGGPGRVGRRRHGRRQPWVEELQGAVVRRRQVTLVYAGAAASPSGPSTRGRSSTRATSGTSSPARPRDAGRSGWTGSSASPCSTPRRPGPTTSTSRGSGSRWSTRSSSAAGA